MLRPGDRWRVELAEALAELRRAVLQGAAEPYCRHRLEGMLRAIEYRLEQARRG